MVYFICFYSLSQDVLPLAMLYTTSMFADLSLQEIIIVVVSLLISVGVHEAMHALVAHRLGDTTASDEGRLTLNPLKHIDVLTTILLPTVMLLLHLPPIFVAKPVPFDPSQVRYGEYGAALMAIAGPFSNFVLAAIAALILRFVPLSGEMVNALLLFLTVNVGLFIFNMLPIPPLDGSRLLYAFAPEPLQRVMYQIESFGFVGLIIIILLLSPVLGPVLSSLNRTITVFLLS